MKKVKIKLLSFSLQKNRIRCRKGVCFTGEELKILAGKKRTEEDEQGNDSADSAKEQPDGASRVEDIRYSQEIGTSENAERADFKQ